MLDDLSFDVWFLLYLQRMYDFYNIYLLYLQRKIYSKKQSVFEWLFID